MPIEVKQSGIEIRTLPSWSAFVEAVRTGPKGIGLNADNFANEVLYRGHACVDWRLWAPLDRRLVNWVKTQKGDLQYSSHRKELGLPWYDQVCAKILTHFKHGCKGLPDFNRSLNDDGYWALGRHFGLLTPLLDWTLSPYVSAFFAFSERLQHMSYGFSHFTLTGNEEKVRIWELAIWEPIEVKDEFEIIRSHSDIGARQRAQSGLFTRLRSQDHLELVPYLEDRGLAHNLVAYDLSMDAAAHAIRDLQLMNIMPRTLFPDVHGAALQANIDNSLIHISSSHYDWAARRLAVRGIPESPA